MFLARLINLVRGKLSQWMTGRERRDPAAVYEAAIGERQRQYAKLREAAASILYMRNKLGRQLGSITWTIPAHLLLRWPAAPHESRVKGP